MYRIELINKKTKEVFNYEYLNDINNGEKLYFKFEIDTTTLTDGDYHLYLYDENDELIVTDTLSVNNFNLNGIQYEKGENIYIENVIDAKTQTKQVEVKDVVTTVYPDEGYNVMTQVTVDAQQVYDNGYTQGKEQGKQDGIEEQKSKLSSITINSNGTYNKEDGYDEVIVNVLPPQQSQPQTEVLLKTITKNGEYHYKPVNADYFKEANINVNVLPKLQQKQVTVTETNTTVTPDSDIDGFSQVSINALPVYNNAYNVGKSDGIEEQKEKLSTITINSNGTYNKEDGYNEVIVDVNTQSYSYLTNTVDEDGLRQLGWNDVDINYFKDNNLHYEWQNKDYIVSQGNKKIVINSVSDIVQYKDNPDFEFCPFFDVSSTDMYYLFKNSKYLKGIPLINLSNVTRMSFMFSGCKNLATIPPIITSNVIDMNYMFSGCASLSFIPQLNTSNVIDMSYMFSGCASLSFIPQLNTSKVEKMGNMFNECKILATIPPIITSNVIDMSDMFNSCNNLTNIPLLDTSNVIDMSYMFNSCNNLTNIPLLDTSNVIDMSYMFKGCASLSSIPQLNTSKVIDMSYMFKGCASLSSIPQLNTSKVEKMGNMLEGCASLQSIGLLDFTSATSVPTFCGYGDLKNLTDLGGFKDLKIDWSDGYGLAKMPNLTKQSVINVINYLYNFRENGDSTSTRTIKFHKNSLALLTDDEKAIATAKGWTLTS